VLKLFSLMYSTYLLLLLLPVLLVSYPRNHCQEQCHKDFSLCLLPRASWFKSLIYIEMFLINFIEE
jgi:hypothetical protein